MGLTETKISGNILKLLTTDNMQKHKVFWKCDTGRGVR